MPRRSFLMRFLLNLRFNLNAGVSSNLRLGCWASVSDAHLVRHQLGSMGGGAREANIHPWVPLVRNLKASQRYELVQLAVRPQLRVAERGAVDHKNEQGVGGRAP